MDPNIMWGVLAMNSNWQTVAHCLVFSALVNWALPAQTVLLYTHSSLILLCFIYPTDVPEEGEVKLFYESRVQDHYRGVLEIWLDDQWGTVSDNNWTIADADTVCRQLGRNGKLLTNTKSLHYSLQNLLRMSMNLSVGYFQIVSNTTQAVLQNYGD